MVSHILQAETILGILDDMPTFMVCSGVVQDRLVDQIAKIY